MRAGNSPPGHAIRSGAPLGYRALTKSASRAMVFASQIFVFYFLPLALLGAGTEVFVSSSGKCLSYI